MKRLILMRHAKSDWSFGTPDVDRPLNPRGQRSAKAMGLWLRDMGHHPDEVLCSSAARTRETLDLLAVAAPTRYQNTLYLASPDDMLTVLRKASGDCVLMLGHNPGIGFLAHALVASSAPDHPRWDDYPTCATLVADFDLTDWADLRPGTGLTVDFTVGRDVAT